MEVEINTQDDIINRYISGEMSEEEKSDFLKSLETDEGLKLRAQMVGLIAREIHHVNSEETIIDALSKTDKDDFRKTLLKLKEEKSASDNVACSIEDGICIRKDEQRKGKVRRAVYSIAASLIALLGCFSIYQYFSEPDYATLGANQIVVTQFRSAGDAELASNLSVLSQKIKENTDIESVITQLDEYYWHGDDSMLKNYRNDIGWNLAIAYLMTNDKDNAIKVLNNIIKENSSREHVEQAKKLLDEINNL